MSAPRLVYVAGVGFSGSTLLSFLVNAHPQLVSVGELTGPLPGSPHDYACSCGTALRECPFFARVRRILRERGVPFDPLAWGTAVDVGGVAPARFLLTRSLRANALDDLRDDLAARLPRIGDRLAEILARNRALAAALCEVSARPVLVDASKQPIRARFLQRAGFDVCLVHLVRDAPGFVASRRRNLGGSVSSAIRHWRRGAAAVARVAGRFAAEHRLQLRYEDVCDDPRAAVNAIATLAGVPPLADGPGLVPVDVHVIGNRMRASFRGRIARDESWRTALAPAEVARVLESTVELRARFGYAPSP